jgi:outer membrane protein assembly factor BamB
VAFEGKAAIGLAPKTGDLLWRFPYTTDFDCNIAAPIEYDGRIFISSGENHGATLLDLKKDGDAFRATPVWESHGPDSVMRNEWQTSILIDGHLYGMDNVGGAGPITHLNCVEVASGKRVWQEKRFGKGNLIAADGKLWISTIKGELVLVRATPGKFEELGRAAILGPTRQAPSLANGLLYLRDEREIVCLDVRER